MYIVQSMYIRVKRQKTTVFLQVEPTDTLLEVKQKLQALIEKVRVTPTQDMRQSTLCYACACRQQLTLLCAAWTKCSQPSAQETLL